MTAHNKPGGVILAAVEHLVPNVCCWGYNGPQFRAPACLFLAKSRYSRGAYDPYHVTEIDPKRPVVVPVAFVGTLKSER